MVIERGKTSLPCRAQEAFLVAEAKDDVDGGLHVDWLVVEQIGTIAPVLHRGDGSLTENLRPTDDLRSWIAPDLLMVASSVTVPVMRLSLANLG